MTDGLSTLYQDLLGGSYDCVDRIVLNTYFRMGHDPGGFRVWWRALTGSDETLENAYLMRLAGRFSRRMRRVLPWLRWLRRHLDEILCAAAVSHIRLRSETASDRGSLRKEPGRRQAKTIIAIAAGPRVRICEPSVPQRQSPSRLEGVKAIQRIGEFYVDAATALVIKHDDGQRSVNGDSVTSQPSEKSSPRRNSLSGGKRESGFAIRCPDDASPTAFCIRVVVVKSLRSQ
jgi:hypothetical protein